MNNVRQCIIQVCIIAVCLMAPNAQAAELRIFGDAGYSDSDDKSTSTSDKSSFAIGGIDLFVTHDIDDKTTAFIEIVFENDGSGFIVDVERLWVSRNINENLNIGLGRFHTPLGYWNRNFHHGALLVDTITRPGFLDFEDGDSAVLPVHIVGIQADGEFLSSAGVLSYVVNIGNGPAYDTTAGFGTGEIEINNVSDNNSDKSGVLRISFAPNETNFAAGISIMNNVIAESGTAGASGVAVGEDLIDQLILGVDAQYISEKLDAIVEYYSLKNDDKFGTAGSHTGSAAYVQLGYRVTENLKPVYRFETIDFDTNDAYRLLLGTMPGDRHVLALRYDLDETNALKFEVSDTKPDVGQSFTTYGIQWAFIIP